MQATLASISAYFQRTTTWLFVTLILLFSYVLTQAADSGALADFLRFVGSLSMISAPVLVYAHFSPSRPASRLRLSLLGVFSVGIFVYGPTVQDLPFTKYLLAPDSLANEQTVRALYLSFGALLGLLWWNDDRADRRSAGWIRRLRLPWVAAGIALVISAGLALTSNYYQASIATASVPTIIASYLLLVPQVFAIYFSYYLIYHVHHHLLFRRLLPERGLLYYLLGAALLVFVFTLLHGWLISFLPAVRQYYIHPVGITQAIVNDVNLGLSLLVFLLSLPFILVVEWSRKERTLSRLQAEKVAAELALLREQINPHFFFNTLNNLYAMSLTQEAETPATILKLSGLMRFVIYKGREERVRLREEVGYLQDYLDLQSIRLQKQADLRFTTDVAKDNLPIAPMLLIILLENAFKHGIEPAETDCFLHAHLTATERSISFSCHNSRPVDLPAAPPGIGLQNLRRRLELLYPDAHELTVRASDQAYHTTLILQL